MPTYQYACTACDHRFEVVQSFSDDALSVCPECEGTLRKVFSAVGVVFKGSGFYRTDSRSSSSSSTAPAGESKGPKDTPKDNKASTAPKESSSASATSSTKSTTSTTSGSAA